VIERSLSPQLIVAYSTYLEKSTSLVLIQITLTKQLAIVN